MQNRIKNKKALADIVASLLIIVLVMSSISLVYVSVKKIIDRPLLSPDSCLSLQIDPPISLWKACYNQTTSTLEVMLRKTSDISINSINFILSPDNSQWCCGQNCPLCALPEGTKTYYINTPRPEKLAVNINSCPSSAISISDC